MSAFKLRTQQSLLEVEHILVRKVQELLSQRLVLQMCLSSQTPCFAMTKSHYHTHQKLQMMTKKNGNLQCAN